jgi:hypothetical protein
LIGLADSISAENGRHFNRKRLRLKIRSVFAVHLNERHILAMGGIKMQISGNEAN